MRPRRRPASPLGYRYPLRSKPALGRGARLTSDVGVLKSQRYADNHDPQDHACPRPGDHVWVEEGTYRGCILDLIRVEYLGTSPRFVCRRSSWPEEITTKYISLYRRYPPCTS